MKTIVVMPGGFHPFHAGHYALYKSAVEAFPGADVYVAATNDQKERPFPFAIKEKLAQIAGVAKGHFIQVTSPFKAQEITSHYNPNQDVLIFVRSEKDRNEQPKPGGMKKDGTPAYFQPYTGKNLQPFSKHAYMAYLPTVEFGPGITSATQIRTAWPTLNSTRKNAMVMSLYPAAKQNPQLTANIVKMMDLGMGGASGLTESVLNEATGYETVDRLVKKLNIDLSGNPYGPLKTKGPSMRVWTRGDGSRYRDPGMILIDQNMTTQDINRWAAEKPMEQFWKILMLLGAKSIGNVTHRNSARPRPAAKLGGLLFVNYGEVIDWGSVSRLNQMQVMEPEVTEELNEHGDKWERDEQGNETGWGFHQDEAERRGREAKAQPMRVADMIKQVTPELRKLLRLDEPEVKEEFTTNLTSEGDLNEFYDSRASKPEGGKIERLVRKALANNASVFVRGGPGSSYMSTNGDKNSGYVVSEHPVKGFLVRGSGRHKFYTTFDDQAQKVTGDAGRMYIQSRNSWNASREIDLDKLDETEQDPQLSKPIKPFNQVKQIPLDALL